MRQLLGAFASLLLSAARSFQETPQELPRRNTNTDVTEQKRAFLKSKYIPGNGHHHRLGKKKA